MGVLENNIFVKDRQKRNAEDFQGCGVGEGKYDAGKERSEKAYELMLPIIILLIMCAHWAFTIYVTSVEIKHVLHSEKYVTRAKKHNGSVSIKVPVDDGWYQKVEISDSLIKDGKVTVYYNEEEGTMYVPQTKTFWIVLYAFGAVITFIPLYWIKKILFSKKHAVKKKEKHSYKDY